VNDEESRLSGESDEATQDPLPDSSVPDAIPIPLPLDTTQTDLKLTFQLRADCEALRNDLEQAQELANDFRAQLSGKSNEAAHFNICSKRRSRIWKSFRQTSPVFARSAMAWPTMMRLQAIEMQNPAHHRAQSVCG
jgi:hypothetical protein